MAIWLVMRAGSTSGIARADPDLSRDTRSGMTVTDQQPSGRRRDRASTPRTPATARNQLPAGVTMVQIKRRYAALRVRPSGIALRTEAGGRLDAAGVARGHQGHAAVGTRTCS